jgi:hypothetical protein
MLKTTRDTKRENGMVGNIAQASGDLAFLNAKHNLANERQLPGNAWHCPEAASV